MNMFSRIIFGLTIPSRFTRVYSTKVEFCSICLIHKKLIPTFNSQLPFNSSERWKKINSPERRFNTTMLNTSKYIDVSLEENGLQKIILNRPAKKNAMDGDMYASIPAILRASAKDPKITVIAFSGVGDYFSSGNDTSNFMKVLESDEQELDFESQLQQAKLLIQEFVAAFIDCPKLLVAVVNGPAVGIGATILALFDIVYASDLATFHCPFIQLAMGPEGCSSLTFPLLMGSSKASEMLILGKKITAQEAFNVNLITEIVDHSNLEECWERIRNICQLPKNSMLSAKSVMKKRLLPLLHKANEEECNNLAERWASEEFLDMVVKLMMKKKSKL